MSTYRHGRGPGGPFAEAAAEVQKCRSPIRAQIGYLDSPSAFLHFLQDRGSAMREEIKGLLEPIFDSLYINNSPFYY